jgi:hypothetical protein
MKKIAKEIVSFLGISVIAAFIVNSFSPVGIAFVGQWDDSKGVITSKAKDNVLIDYNVSRPLINFRFCLPC